MSKQMKAIAAFAIPHACIIFLCLIMILLNVVSPFIAGFGVDSIGRLYVGENDSIKIYQDGQRVGVIALRSSNYAFTVDSNDRILVAYPSSVYLMDISGNKQKIMEDDNAQIYSQFKSDRSTIISANGDRYKCVGKFGWTRIVRNSSEVVYKISVFSFAIKCLMLICTISMFVNGVWVVHQVRKINAHN